MNEQDLRAWILDTYGVSGDCPWENDDSTVFRHPGSRKWFALLMHLSPARLRLPGTETLNVLNVKTDPISLGAFLEKPGFYPAYHMNKSAWISIVIDAVEENDLKFLLDQSFILTDKRLRRPLPTV